MQRSGIGKLGLLLAFSLDTAGPSRLAAAEAPPKPTMPSWASQVRTIVQQDTGRLNRKLRDGAYLVTFNISADGKVSGVSVTGEHAVSASSALIIGALAKSTFPLPPDGQDHAISVREVVVGHETPRRK